MCVDLFESNGKLGFSPELNSRAKERRHIGTMMIEQSGCQRGLRHDMTNYFVMVHFVSQHSLVLQYNG